MKSKEIQIFGQYLLSKFCYTFLPLFSGIYFINQTLIFFCNLQLLCGIRFSNSRYTGRFIMFSVITNTYNKKSSCHTRISMCGKNLNIVSMCAVSPVVHTLNISSCQKKKNFFSFPVAVKNSTKVGPLVFLL